MNATMVPRDDSCPACQRLRTNVGAERWGALCRWYESLTPTPASPKTLDRALTTLKTLVPADRVSLLVPVAEAKLHIFSCSNRRHVGDLLISLDRYPELQFVLDNTSPVFIQDVRSAELLRPVLDLIETTRIRSIAAVPLVLAGVPAILRMSATIERFRPQDLETIKTAAHLLEHLAASAQSTHLPMTSWQRLLLSVADMAADILPDTTILRAWGNTVPVLGLAAKEAAGKRLSGLGLFAEEPLTTTVARLMASLRQEGMAEPLRTAMEHGVAVSVTRDGSLIPFFRLVVRQAGNGDTSAIRSTPWEVTTATRYKQLQENLARTLHELEEAQDTIVHLQTQRTELIASAAHELKTPLTIAQSYLETLKNDLSTGMSDEQVSFVTIAYENVLRLKRLVKDLVDLAAIEGGEISLAIGRVEIVPIIQTLAAELTPIASRNGIDIAHDAAPNLPAIRGDAQRVAQVLRNLLDNALKYTPAPGSIAIRARHEGDAVVVDVEDSGIGFPESLADRVFEPFFRAPKPSGFLRDGSGLGLTVSRRIVSALGGKLTAMTRPEGGSIFRLTLPRWPESFADRDE